MCQPLLGSVTENFVPSNSDKHSKEIRLVRMRESAFYEINDVTERLCNGCVFGMMVNENIKNGTDSLFIQLFFYSSN